MSDNIFNALREINEAYETLKKVVKKMIRFDDASDVAEEYYDFLLEIGVIE